MKIEADAKLVTIYVNSTDQWHGQSLYAAIVAAVQGPGIAGVTVMRCIEGYGGSGRIHTSRLLELRRIFRCGSRSWTSPSGSSRSCLPWNQ